MIMRKFLQILFCLACVCCLSACQHPKPQDPLKLLGFYEIDPRLSPTNLHARFTLVEFFDYRCEACAAAFPAIQELQAIDPQVQVIYRELPFLGSNSEFAARAAIAAALQGKYQLMHDTLMQAGPGLDKNTVLDIAKKIGLNLTKLSDDMQSSFVNQQLFQNSLLAGKIVLQSTPTYLFAQTSWQNGQLHVGKVHLLRGAQTLEQLKNEVIALNV